MLRNFFFSVSSHILLLMALSAVCVGVFWLEEMPGSVWWGYSSVILGGGLLAFLPRRFSLASITRAEWGLLLSLSTIMVAALAQGVYSFVLAGVGSGAYSLQLQWWSAVLISVFAAFCADRLLGVECNVPRGRTLVFLLVFLSALLVRSFGHRTLVVDEFIHTDYLLKYLEQPHPLVLGVLGEDGYPFSLIYLQALLYRPFAMMVDPVSFQKAVSIVCGALSVAFWYVAVRLRSGAITAACTAILLVLFGWHWLNSKFIYAYPFDLALTSFGIMGFLLALRFKSFFWAAMTGCAMGAALVLQKGGVLLLPIVGYLFLEGWFAAARGEGRRICGLLAVSAITCLLSSEPFLLQLLKGDNVMPLHGLAAREQAELLPKLGFSRLSAVLYVVGDAFQQFQVSINDFNRHMFRPRAPILDPVFSVLVSIGFMKCLIDLRRSPAARLCIIGLLLFILPMALSFPLSDQVRGVSRRMIGASFFLAWIGALGAELVARRIAPANLVRGTAVTICSVSALTNAWMLFALYDKQPGYEFYSQSGRGLQSRAMIDLIFDAEASKIRTVALEADDATLFGIPDSSERKLSTLTRVKTVEELRLALTKYPGVMQLVVVPWDSRTKPRNSQALVQSLSDIIPPYLWISGREDQDGIPMVRYAYVRIAP